VVAPLIFLLLVANTINIGADLGAMGASVHLLTGFSPLLGAMLMGVGSMLLQVFVPYSRYVSILKWLTLAVFSYVAIPFAVTDPWPEVILSIVVPRISLSSDYITAFVAVLGTTISPYLFFWQSSQEVEERGLKRKMRSSAFAIALKRSTRGTNPSEYFASEQYCLQASSQASVRTERSRSHCRVLAAAMNAAVSEATTTPASGTTPAFCSNA
jgi:Mn2+/Fe2+ NRAMP family transporter